MNHWTCTTNGTCLMLLPLMKEIFHFRGRLIGDVVGFSTTLAVGEGILTHLFYVSLVSSQMETVSKTCLFTIGQYHLALLNFPQEEAYEHLFRCLIAELHLQRSLENLIGLLSYGLVYQDLYLHHFEDIFGAPISSES